MVQMAQDSQQRFDLLERNLRDQAMAINAGAQVEVRALEALSKMSNVVDIKGVGKPELLKGSHEDAKKAWKSWSYKFESWFASQYLGSGQDILGWAKAFGDTTIQESDIQTKVNSNPKLATIDGHLHRSLVSLTSNMPYMIVFNSRKKCGLDSWRRLSHMYQPHNPRSNLRLLRHILVQPRATLDSLRAAIHKWEADLVEYVQRSNQDLSDPQKITVLLNVVPESSGDEHRQTGYVRQGAC